VSVPSNIAEGCGRDSDPDFRRFLQIALGSGNEVQYLLILSNALKMLSANDHQTLEEHLMEVRRMLISFICKLRPSRF
jgi:four helix bundle protein